MAHEIQITPARTLAELEGIVEVIRRHASGDEPTAEMLEHDLATEPHTLFLRACVGGELAGSGVGKQSSMPGCLYAMVRVLPEHRRRGYGEALYRELSKHALRAGRPQLVGRIREDDRESLGFAERRGFVEVSRECHVALDVSRAAEPPPPPAGVEIVSLAERPDLVRAAYEVERETVPDIPAQIPNEPWSFERWHSSTLESPGALLEGTFVALVDEEVVGYAGLMALAQPGAAENLLTAVRRPWRGRGIATALKRAQIGWAKQAGIRRIVTTNDESNAPMRAVNARLGYEPEPAWLLVRGPTAA